MYLYPLLLPLPFWLLCTDAGCLDADAVTERIWRVRRMARLWSFVLMEAEGAGGGFDGLLASAGEVRRWRLLGLLPNLLLLVLPTWVFSLLPLPSRLLDFEIGMDSLDLEGD